MANPDIDKDFGDLEFGRGEMLVEHIGLGLFVGRLIFGETYQFRLDGVANPGDPPTFTFRGVGDAEESQGQVYEYFGCLMPLWPHDRKQRPTIVGTVIRAAPSGDDKAPKGLAANFIALKRDVLPAPSPTPEPAKPEPTAPGPSGPDASTPAPTDPAPPDPTPPAPEPSTPEPPGPSTPEPPKPDPPGPSTPGPSGTGHTHAGGGQPHAEGDPYRRP